jgi:hypothetical protein
MPSMHARREHERQVRPAPANRLVQLAQTLVKCSRAAVHAVDEPQRLPAMGYRQLRCAVPEPMEDAGQWEAAR